MAISRRNLFCVQALTGENGFILISVLTLMVTLILVGATTYIVSSSNAKIGGNYKTSETALQVAMAGTEQARENLRSANAASTITSDFSQELAAHAGANGVLNAYPTTVDDTTLANGTMNVGGISYTYNAYVTNDSTAPDVSTSTTDTNGRVVITSVATGPNNSKAIVTTTVQLYTFSSSSPAVVYSKDNVTLNGSAISINGSDAGSCGGTSLAPVYTKDPATTNSNGSPVMSGSPSTPQHGTTDIDLQAYVDALKGSATTTLTADVSNATYGSATNYVTVYADATGTQADHELRLNNVDGYGVLIVKGDLQLAGNINWHGIIIVTGIVSSSGGGSNSKNIQGQVYAGSSSLGDTAISGNIDIGYNSCEVKKSLSSQPLKVVNWKQS
jgi:Tfp pilus assembly protein PilX